jgi:hypothetical protein
MRDRLNRAELRVREGIARLLRSVLGKVMLRDGNTKPAFSAPIDEADRETRERHSKEVQRVKDEINRNLRSQGK